MSIEVLCWSRVVPCLAKPHSQLFQCGMVLTGRSYPTITQQSHLEINKSKIYDQELTFCDFIIIDLTTNLKIFKFFLNLTNMFFNHFLEPPGGLVVSALASRVRSFRIIPCGG